MSRAEHVSEVPVIRSASSEDADAVCALVVAAGLFTEEEARFLPTLMDDITSSADELHAVVVDTDEAGAVTGVALWRPVEMAEGVTELTMIAVDPAVQGRGRGRALMRHAETAARSIGQRMMLVQTSGTGQYEGTRAFYAALGYDEEARVRDYWSVGDDLVIFRKLL